MRLWVTDDAVDIAAVAPEATTADLVAALKEQGAEIRWTTTHELWHNGVRRVIEIGGPSGRYLVYRFPEGS